MRSLLLVVVTATALSGQQPRVTPEPMRATIRAVGSTRSPLIAIRISGELFHSLGIAKGSVGELSLWSDKGTARGTLTAELSTESGELVFSADPSGPELEIQVWPATDAAVPRYQARGHTVRVGRAATGALYVLAGR